VLDAAIAGRDVIFGGVRVFDGERFLTGVHDVVVRSGRVDSMQPAATDRLTDRSGGVLFPGFVDAHVHLSFSNANDVVLGGVTGVLDLGAPADYAFSDHAPLRLRAAGPLVTAPGGYPTTSWGANGYGLEVATAAEARETVAMLADRGAAIIKIAIEPSGGPVLDDVILGEVVAGAHARGLAVAAHALSEGPVRSALDAGADVLAHTPIEPLSGDTVRELGARGVKIISTLRAFGASPAARDNLAKLADAGCPIAYGTDLGNGPIRAGIDVDELGLLEGALGGRTQALAAATSTAGTLAGSGGRLAPGLPADLVWVPRFDSLADLRRDAEVLVGR
jgi:imidazolonepropionase-like amidohydrolase